MTTEQVAVVKIALDRVKCTGLGLCEAQAPDVFEVDDDGELLILAEDVDPARLDAVKAAVQGCPTEALRLVED